MTPRDREPSASQLPTSGKAARRRRRRRKRAEAKARHKEAEEKDEKNSDSMVDDDFNDAWADSAIVPTVAPLASNRRAELSSGEAPAKSARMEELQPDTPEMLSSELSVDPSKLAAPVSQSSTGRPPTPVSLDGFTVGQTVVLHGLVARPDLSGQRAEVISIDLADGRCAVKLATGQSVRVRTKNLKRSIFSTTVD